MATLLYARYPVPQIIQATINTLNKVIYQSKISIFQQCCFGKILFIISACWSCLFRLFFISSLLAPKGRNASFYCCYLMGCRCFLRLWPPVTPNPDFSAGEFFLTAVMVVRGENCTWLSNPLHLLICYLGSQMTAHKYTVKKGGTALLRSENAVSYALIRLQVPWGRAVTPTLRYFMYQTE